jgi:uncharacterized protein YuzE
MKQLYVTCDYDYKVDAIDIDVIGDYNYKETVELGNGVYLDFDENNIPVALEILSASKILNIDKKNLINPEIHMIITINNDLIRVEVEFIYIIHNKKISESMTNKVANNYNIPSIETTLISA